VDGDARREVLDLAPQRTTVRAAADDSHRIAGTGQLVGELGGVELHAPAGVGGEAMRGEQHAGPVVAGATRRAGRQRQARVLEQGGKDDVMGEVLAGDLPGGAPMPLVVAVDGVDRLRGLLDRGECEEALAGRQDVAEPGVLGDHRAAGGQVGGAAVAEPAAAQPDVLVLGDGELPSRSGDVSAVGVEIGGDPQGIANAPAMLGEQQAVLVGAAGQGELEGLRRAFGQVEDLQELEMLAPLIGLARELDAPLLAPVGDRREDLPLPLVLVLPMLEHDGLACRPDREALQGRQQTIRVAVVLAEGEDRSMVVEELDRRAHLLVQLHLHQHGIGRHADQPVAAHVFGTWSSAAVEVEEDLGRGVEIPQPRLADAKAAAVGGEGVEGPAMRESEATEEPVDERGRPLGPVVLLPRHEVSRGERVGLHVPGFVAESLEAQQIVQRLPEDPPEGHRRHLAEDDRARARLRRHHAPPPTRSRTGSSFTFRSRERACREA
jgi:hypothetical protein